MTRLDNTRAIVVPAVFVGLALALWLVPWPFDSPVTEAAAVPEWVVDPQPIRSPKLEPVIELAGFTYRCSDCHDLFPSPPETVRTLTQHRDIELKHGINTRCFNCHHLTDRNSFVDDWGRPIPYDQPQLMCAKCHGPVYRDWLNGSHGRTNGYWDKSLGPQQRRKCIECHDPHQPPFPPMAPAPAPHTLRMSPPALGETHETQANPLRVYRTSTTTDHAIRTGEHDEEVSDQ